MRASRLVPLLGAALLPALAACPGGPLLRGPEDPPRVLRERAAQLRRIPLTIGDARRLRFEDFDGSVVITATDRGQPEMRAHLRTVAGDHEQAAEILDSLRITVERDEEAAALMVRLEQPELARPFLTSSSYELSVPVGLEVNVVNESGDVELRGAFASSSIMTSFGNVLVSGIPGNLAVETVSGNVDVQRVEGDRVVVKSRHGDVALRYVQADVVKTETRAGDISLEWVRARVTRGSSKHGVVEAVGLEGSANLTTRDSKLLLETVEGRHTASLRIGRSEVASEGGGGLIDITSAFGRVDVVDFEGTVVVDSDHGNVSIGGVLDEVRAASSSGTLSVAAREGSTTRRKWIVHAESGNVVLALPASFACRLDARTRKGTIRSDFDVVLDADETGFEVGILRGLLNGGGESVSVRSDSGRIRIRRTGI